MVPLYGWPNVSASDKDFLKKQRNVVCLFFTAGEAVKIPRDHKLPCMGAIVRTVSSPPPHIANLNQPRNISKYDRATALTLVTSRLMNKIPLEPDSY